MAILVIAAIYREDQNASYLLPTLVSMSGPPTPWQFDKVISGPWSDHNNIKDIWSKTIYFLLQQ